MNTKTCQKLAQEISLIRSGLLLTSWTIETINEEVEPETTKQFELLEGTSFFLDLLVGRLTDIYRKLNAE